MDQYGNEHAFKAYLGEMTPPEAEFRGLICALDMATSVTRGELEVRMDSELVIRWMNGQYRIKKTHIRPLFDEAKKLSSRYKAVTYIHHPGTSTLGRKAHDLAGDAFIEHQK